MVGVLNNSVDGHRWFMSEIKRRVNRGEEENWLRKIAEAIGDRRIQDLVDIVAEMEMKYGWPTILRYLEQSMWESYFVPTAMGGPQIPIEPLKYREAIFALFSSSGIEPIPKKTSELLLELGHMTSFASAANQFGSSTLSYAIEQIELGDTMFFESLDGHISAELKSVLERRNSEAFAEAYITRNGKQLDLNQIWHTEKGRKVLAQLGVSRYIASSEHVIQDLQVLLPIALKDDDNKNGSHLFPSKPEYRKLLQAIIEQDVSTLCILGSRHAAPTLDFLLNKAVLGYEEKQTASNYQSFLSILKAHVLVRAPTSIDMLSLLSKRDDKRIVMPAILALQCFCDERAVYTLIDLICNSTDNETISTARSALEWLHSRCAVAEPLLFDALRSSCNHSEILRSLLKLRRWTSRTE